MKCLNTDQLAAYYDGILVPEEAAKIMAHVASCPSCEQVLALYEQEESFLTETLATPTLPDDFEAQVLAQIAPYKPKKRLWKRGVVAAATVLLAGGIAFSTTPTFATLVQSLFAVQSDEGIQMALENGAVVPVNIEAVSGKTTLLIEDILVDTSRVGFTYRIIKGNGGFAEPYFEERDGNTLTFTDAVGNELPIHMHSWSRIEDDFGMFLFDLPSDFEGNELFLQVNLERIGFRRGSWQATVPFDLTEARKQSKTYALTEQHEAEGVEVALHDLRFTSSLTSLTFSTGFTEAEFARLQAERDKLVAVYGAQQFGQLEPFIAFSIQNEAGDTVASSDFSDGHSISSTGEMLNDGGRRTTQAFEPLHNEGNLIFVLEGVFKPRPVEYSVKLQKGERLEMGGDQLTVQQVDTVRENGQRLILVKLTGETRNEELANARWRATTGDANYDVYLSGGTNEKVEGSGIFVHDYDLRIYGLKNIPDDLQLTMTELLEYKPLAEPWRVPLMQ